MSRTLTDHAVLEAILQFNRGRKRRLVRLKLRRMMGDPFTFFRGTNHLFAQAWPELRPPDVGPDILICGDLHLENFGAYRTAEGDLPLTTSTTSTTRRSRRAAWTSSDARPASSWPPSSGC